MRIADELLSQFSRGRRPRRERVGPGYTEPGRSPVKPPLGERGQVVVSAWMAPDGTLHRRRKGAVARIPRRLRGHVRPRLVAADSEELLLGIAERTAAGAR